MKVIIILCLLSLSSCTLTISLSNTNKQLKKESHEKIVESKYINSLDTIYYGDRFYGLRVEKK